MAEEEGPKDPFTPANEGAAQLHEIFASYMDAGFTEAQALYLLGEFIKAVTIANGRGGTS